jgi:glycerol-3-phosphate cytidylyltransferase
VPLESRGETYMKKIVITYGTFDLFHIGHLKLLKRLRALGDSLIVGVSTDDFNIGKGKKSIIGFENRIEIIQSLSCVDLAIPENSWEQKEIDIKKLNVSTFGIGDDWQGKFDHLKSICEVVYLPRTDGVSSTQIKEVFSQFSKENVIELKKAMDIISSIVERLD